MRGFLKEIHFKEGGDIKRGQLLFVIDEEPFKAKLAEAQAALEQAEASLKKAGDSKAREVAAAQVDVGKSTLVLSEVEERREQLLYKRNASSLEDVQRKQRFGRGTRRRSKRRRPAWIRPKPTLTQMSSPPRRMLTAPRPKLPTPRST